MADPTTATTTRESIIAAADRLFYERGFEHTSFADIAERVKISRGNFYHHFKAKDEILAAVIVARHGKTQAMLARWTGEGDGPLARLQCFAGMLIRNRRDIADHGCPVGTLCAELGKLGHAAAREAGGIFGLFRVWLGEQFTALGLAKEADALAMHLLARSQGIASLANAFNDEAFIRHEAALLSQWLNGLVPPPASRKRRVA